MMKNWQDDDRRIPSLRDPAVHVLNLENVPCDHGGWNKLIMGHNGSMTTRTLYVVPKASEVQPRAEGIMYVVRDMAHLIKTTKTGFSVVEVEILGQVPTLGKKIEVQFYWDDDRRSGKSGWRAVLNDRSVSVILTPEDHEVSKLGAKVKTNCPRWEVIPRVQAYCSGSGKFRILKVELVRQIFASPRAERIHNQRQQQMNGGDQSSFKPSAQKSMVPAARPAPKLGRSIIADMIVTSTPVAVTA
jgi:hypothetical protein